MTVARSLGIKVFHPTGQGRNDPVVRWDPTHKNSSHRHGCSLLRAVQSVQARSRLVFKALLCKQIGSDLSLLWVKGSEQCLSLQ